MRRMPSTLPVAATASATQSMSAWAADRTRACSTSSSESSTESMSTDATAREAGKAANEAGSSSWRWTSTCSLSRAAASQGALCPSTAPPSMWAVTMRQAPPKRRGRTKWSSPRRAAAKLVPRCSAEPGMSLTRGPASQKETDRRMVGRVGGGLGVVSPPPAAAFGSGDEDGRPCATTPAAGVP
jgi:hypothetical protein